MKNITTTRTLAALAICAAFFLISIPTTVTADQTCPDPSPSAWVNYCIKLVPDSAVVPTADPDLNLNWDPNCMSDGQIEPITGVKITVPTDLDCLLDIEVDPDPGVDSMSVSYDKLQVRDTHVNDERVLEDICRIWSGNPDECDVSGITTSDSTGNGLPDGLLVFIGNEPGLFIAFPTG